MSLHINLNKRLLGNTLEKLEQEIDFTTLSYIF
jgi:hypothetical protein